MSEKVDRILTANGIVVNQGVGHVGVKGMKWGVRKSRSSSSSSNPRTKTTKSPPTKVPNSFKNKPQNRRMSDAELRNKLNRLQMEKQFKELTSSPKGKSFVRDVLQDTGKQVARQVVKTAANVALEMALNSLAKDAKPGSFVTQMAAQATKKKK